MEKIIKTLEPSPCYYRGEFEACINGISVSGYIVLNDEKEIESLRGGIKLERDKAVHFSAYLDNGKLVYNFSELEDMEQLPQIMTSVADAVKAIEAELAAGISLQD